MQSLSQREFTTVQEEKRVEEPPGDSNGILAQLMAFFCHPSPPRCILLPFKILQTRSTKNCNIDIQLEKAVHGYLSPDRKQRASLLVFGVQLISRRKATPFERIELEARVVETQGLPSSRPEILAHAPFLTEEALKASKVQVKNTKQVEDSANVGFNLGAWKFGTGSKMTEGKQFDSVDNYFGKGSSATIIDEDRKTSGIWWNVKQSSWSKAKDDAGIDPNYRFAILLIRSRDDKAAFKVKFSLRVHAGLGHLIENKFTHSIHVEDLTIDPRTWYVGDCEAIDRQTLGHYQRPENLVTLTKWAR